MSLLTSFSRPVGGGQLSPVMPTDLRLFTVAGAISASTAYLHKFRVSSPVRVSAVKVRCIANASGFNGDAGLFSLVGSTYTLLASSGSTAVGAATTGILTFTLTAAYSLTPGVDYWMAFVSDSATPTFDKIAPAASDLLLSEGSGGLAINKASLIPLASFTSPSQTSHIVQIWAV